MQILTTIEDLGSIGHTLLLRTKVQNWLKPYSMQFYLIILVCKIIHDAYTHIYSVFIVELTFYVQKMCASLMVTPGDPYFKDLPQPLELSIVGFKCLIWSPPPYYLGHIIHFSASYLLSNLRLSLLGTPSMLTTTSSLGRDL